MLKAMAKISSQLGPLVLATLLVAQISLALHKTTHSDALQETQCALCASADHVSGPAPAGTTQLLVLAEDESVDAAQTYFDSLSGFSPYESRAPPRSS